MISQLEDMTEQNSPHYELSRKFLKYIKKSGRWKTIEDVEKADERYDELESEVMAKNEVAKFVEKYFPR